MKIALAQQNYIVGDFEHNVGKIISAISTAKTKGACLVVFSELSVCGYPPYDLLCRTDFIQKCLTAVEQVAKHCIGISAIVEHQALTLNFWANPYSILHIYLARVKSRVHTIRRCCLAMIFLKRPDTLSQITILPLLTLTGNELPLLFPRIYVTTSQ